ncbi:hypothetical protein GIB67_027894 [Kingdonia uniflora]|uniref:Oxidative stress 3 n=1 Tax=Kingdonia uniflora TaxID=39325 RepID=A0A7J7LGD6_9MAGN|nr:hypothetical protein GIB67_027894 [Kingdonia uniflora]
MFFPTTKTLNLLPLIYHLSFRLLSLIISRDMGIDSMTTTFHDPWMTRDDDDGTCDSFSTTASSSFDGSSTSLTPSSSLDLVEDASSYSSSNGPLYELSELMAHLPIKRGLSKHFEGKSQSFTSLCNVRCIEDLAKKENPYTKKMKSCRSYARSENHNLYATKACSKKISKKVSRGSSFSLLSRK